MSSLRETINDDRGTIAQYQTVHGYSLCCMQKSIQMNVCIIHDLGYSAYMNRSLPQHFASFDYEFLGTHILLLSIYRFPIETDYLLYNFYLVPPAY